MTERLYYEDAYLWQFTARVVQVREGQTPGLWELALDRSAFYPTSGGQPFDTGTLTAQGHSARVTNVEVDASGVVWHTVDFPFVPGQEAEGRIDGARRTDHMEQHGGEHMLAGAVWELLGGTTIGLHLGSDFSTIDVEMPDGRTHLTEEEMLRLEDLVNTRIRLDAPIRCWFPTEEELATLPLRKPPTVKEHIRIVAMGDFEMVACGGTHPSSTGRIGTLALLSALPARGKVRLSFVCGKRACDWNRKMRRAAQQAGKALSCPAEGIAEAIGEEKNRLNEAENRLSEMEKSWVLEKLQAKAETAVLPGISLCCLLLPECNFKAVQDAARQWTAQPGRIALICMGDKLCFARSVELQTDMGKLLRSVGRGGGRPELASGTGTLEDLAAARESLMKAYQEE